ncbi:MAG TPA: hypothetical protein VMS14_00500 [Ilumatobacteraceae bacterium]|nr:hypothetical protein [Ilumatobacteraceae bacterium]
MTQSEGGPRPLSEPAEFVGQRSRLWLFGAGLGVVLFGGLCIGIPFEEHVSWGAEIAFGVLLLACLAWLAYLLWAPTMRLTIAPDTVTCTSRLAPVRIDRSTGDLLVFEKVRISNGRGSGITYWKLRPSDSPRGVLLTQWDPARVADACRANRWQVEWRDRDGAVMNAP